MNNSPKQPRDLQESARHFLGQEGNRASVTKKRKREKSLQTTRKAKKAEETRLATILENVESGGWTNVSRSPLELQEAHLTGMSSDFHFTN